MKTNPFTKYILGIEFGENLIKLVILRSEKNKYHLIKSESFIGSEKENEEHLTNFLKDNPLKFSRVVASLNRYIVSSRYIQLPSSQPQEIEKMIPFQIRRLFPYTADDVVFSFDILDTNADGFSNVALFVAQKERVQRLLQLLQDARIKPDILTISSVGLLNWYSAQNEKPLNDSVALVDLNQSYLELCVINKQVKITYSRSVLIHDKSEITNEIKKCLEIYNKESKANVISKLLLIAEQNKYKDIASEISAGTNIPAEIINPWQNLPIIYKNVEDNLASIIGLLISEKPTQINLLPEEEKSALNTKLKQKQRNRSIFLLVGLVLAIFLNIIFYINTRSRHLRDLDKKLSLLWPEIDKLSDMQKKLLFVQRQLEQRYAAIQILDELYKITPEGILLNIFIYEKDNQAVIKGAATEMSLVFEYVSILEKSKFLKNAEVRFATKRSAKGQEFTDFEIFCSLEGA